jgi:hypothetical protein
MSRDRGALIAFALVLVLAGCATGGGPRVESDRAPDAPWERYATFAFADGATTGAGGAPLRLTDVNVRKAIRAALARRGYVEADRPVDLLVEYETVTQDKVKSNPVSVGIGMGTWGGNVGGSVGVGTPNVESYQEGRLEIRAIDARDNREVWVGRATDRMKEDGLGEKEAARVVNLALRDFPTRAPAAVPQPVAAPVPQRPSE